MKIIPQTTPEKSPIETKVERMVEALNTEFERRVAFHRNSYNQFWNSQFTPAEILEEMGASAGLYLATAVESIENIATLAAVGGLTLDAVIEPSAYAPRLALTPHPDGSVAIAAPSEGFDAWGRPLVVPTLPGLPG